MWLKSDLPLTPVYWYVLVSDLPLTPVYWYVLVSHLPLTPVYWYVLVSDLPLTPVYWYVLISDLPLTPVYWYVLVSDLPLTSVYWYVLAWGDLRKPYYRSHANDLMSWIVRAYGTMGSMMLCCVFTSCYFNQFSPPFFKLPHYNRNPINISVKGRKWEIWF